MKSLFILDVFVIRSPEPVLALDSYPSNFYTESIMSLKSYNTVNIRMSYGCYVKTPRPLPDAFDSPGTMMYNFSKPFRKLYTSGNNLKSAIYRIIHLKEVVLINRFFLPKISLKISKNL